MLPDWNQTAGCTRVHPAGCLLNHVPPSPPGAEQRVTETPWKLKKNEAESPWMARISPPGQSARLGNLCYSQSPENRFSQKEISQSFLSINRFISSLLPIISAIKR
jgi:hypothetical protein